MLGFLRPPRSDETGTSSASTSSITFQVQLEARALLDPLKLTYIKGSALGVRVAGGLIGTPLGWLVGMVNWTAPGYWINVLLLMPFAFIAVRPWFLGVWTGEGVVEVRSWFRTHRFSAGEVDAVELVPYTGFAGYAIGWLPFVGAIRMLEVDVAARWLPLWLPSTLARRNRALRLAREVRSSLGLPPR